MNELSEGGRGGVAFYRNTWECRENALTSGCVREENMGSLCATNEEIRAHLLCRFQRFQWRVKWLINRISPTWFLLLARTSPFSCSKLFGRHFCKLVSWSICLLHKSGLEKCWSLELRSRGFRNEAKYHSAILYFFSLSLLRQSKQPFWSNADIVWTGD